jgi:hypothetical protein
LSDLQEDKIKILDDYIDTLTRERDSYEAKISELLDRIKTLRKEDKHMLSELSSRYCLGNPEVGLLWKELSLYMNITRLNILTTDDKVIQCYINNKYKDKITYLEINLNDSDPHTRAKVFWQTMQSLFN